MLKYSCTFGIGLTRKCLFVHLLKLQWNFYSGDTLQTKASVPRICGHFLSAKVSSEWGLNLGFATQKKCPFPLNRGVPSIKLTNTKIM